MSTLILGTAQFGASYGITNAVGRIDDRAMSELLEVASRGGITLFDTAADYGDAQQRLGELNRVDPPPRYVSKFSLPAEGEPVTAASLFLDSVRALHATGLHGLLFHRLADLHDPRVAETWRLIQTARDAGDISRVGASIYDLDDLDEVETALPGFDLLQIPGNLVDRRLLDSPRLRALHDAGVEIHVRSVYLQGLLLSDPATLAPHFAALVPVLSDLRTRVAKAGITMLDLALGYLASHPVADAVLVGATTADELRGTLAAWSAGNRDSTKAVLADLPDSGLPATVTDPRSWPPREAS